MIRPALLGLISALLLTACSQQPDEAQIRSRLDDMVTALEKRNARAFMAPLAEDFAADTWQLDQRGVRLLLTREMRAHDRIRARLFDIDIRIDDPDRGMASFHAILTGGSGLLPEQGSWYRVTTGWRREEGDWQLISAQWERVAGR